MSDTKVIDIEDYRPHLVVFDTFDDIHIMPESLIQDIIDGKMSVTELEDYEIIIPFILSEWLEMLKE